MNKNSGYILATKKLRMKWIVRIINCKIGKKRTNNTLYKRSYECKKEKDYYITLALRELSSRIRGMVFKEVTRFVPDYEVAAIAGFFNVSCEYLLDINDRK